MLRDWITLPHTDSVLTSVSMILIRGWTLLIVSFLVFCYLAFRRRASLRPSAIVAIVANSLGKSSVMLLIAIMILNYADALRGDWGFFPSRAIVCSSPHNGSADITAFNVFL